MGWNLYVITDINMAAPRSYLQIVREILEGGSNVIQIRDKTTPFDELMEIGKKIRQMVNEYGATMIVNDNPYLAREIDADGVHLGQHDMPVDIAREIVGQDKIIGLSTHSKQQALISTYQDVDYIGVGPVFSTSTKKSGNKPLGTDTLAWIIKMLRTPVVAIGGIGSENISEVAEKDIAAPAVVSAIMKSKNLTNATRDLIDIIKKVRKESNDTT